MSMIQPPEEWFEPVQIGDRRFRHVSKFFRKDFVVSREFVEGQWHAWTREQRLKFAGAFAARAELNDDDQGVLDFLMDKGYPEVWCTIALSVARHRDPSRATDFLLKRVKEDSGPLSNYYQALEMVQTQECVPVLRAALLKHRQQVELHPSLQSWGDRFFYLDYLSCSATLFKITGQEEYRINIQGMLQHPNEVIRNMARMVATSSNISLS